MSKQLTIAPEDSQQVLIDVLPVYNCQNNAQARNAYGAAAQEIVWRTLKITPIPINGNFDVCFDGKGKDGEFYEIKSVRRHGKLVLFDFRMRKEKDSGQKVLYAILVHNLHCCRADVLTAMLNSRPEILVVEAEKVHAIALTCPLRKLQGKNPKRGEPNYNGYAREGYAEGYRNVSVQAVRSVSKVVQVDTLFL